MSKIAAITAVTVGVTLVTIACFIPHIKNEKLESQSEQQTEMTPDNEAKWATVPGQYDMSIMWQHWVYNLTNYNAVRALLVTQSSRSSTKTNSPCSRKKDPSSTKRTRTTQASSMTLTLTLVAL